jgi:hypothetical protein
MSETTIPGMFTVLVGDDPERRVATIDGPGWQVHLGPTGGWVMYSSRAVHDAVEVIPEGTPVERIVVLPDVGEAVRQDDGAWLVDGQDYFGWTPAQHRDFAAVQMRTAAKNFAVAAAQDRHAAYPAARADEPTPDPLAQAREQVRRAIVRGTWPALREAADSLLAATETDR